MRAEKGMTLEQLSQQTKIPAFTLGSYESNDYEEIPHRNIIELAKYPRTVKIARKHDLIAQLDKKTKSC